MLFSGTALNPLYSGGFGYPGAKGAFSLDTKMWMLFYYYGSDEEYTILDGTITLEMYSFFKPK